MADADRALGNREYERARAMLESLARQGYTDAEFKLAGMYVDAVGIPRNLDRGMNLYKSAARKGHAGAMFFLATELNRGVLLKTDKKRALALLRTSSKLKNPAAQYALCEELSRETGDAYDPAEAYAWCVTSTNRSHKNAGEAARLGKSILAKLQESKGAEAVQEARNRAANYTKAY